MPKSRRAHYDMLLRVRRRQEDIRAQALAAASRDVRVAEQQRAALAGHQRLMFEEAGARVRDRLDPQEVRMYYQYERHLARLIDEKDAAIIELRGIAEARRAELEEAMKRRRIVEKLKERREHTFMAQARKEEQRLADEAATNHAAVAPRGGRHGVLS